MNQFQISDYKNIKIRQLMMCFEGLKIVLGRISSASLYIQFGVCQTSQTSSDFLHETLL